MNAPIDSTTIALASAAINVRASSLGEFMDCAARWEAKHLLGKRMPSSGAAQLGSAVHKSTAVFDSAILAGNPLTIDEAAAAAVDVLHRPDQDVDWGDDETPHDAEKVALSLHRKYCEQIAPTQVYAAVEVQCERLEIADLGIALTGTTDRVRRTIDGFAVTDIKTGKTAVRSDGSVETKGHAYQLGAYELLAQAGSGLPITGPAQIAGLNTAKTEKAQRVALGTVHGGRDVLLGDDEHPGILHTIARVLHEGLFFGNPRSMLCNPKYCPIYNACYYRR